MIRTTLALNGFLGVIGVLASTSSCSSSSSTPGDKTDRVGNVNPTCVASSCGSDGAPSPSGGVDGGNGVLGGGTTDVDCGGPVAPKCAEGKRCVVDGDCEVACGYAKTCVGAPSCTTHLGGDTCGVGELEDAMAQHESCCQSLRVPGYSDPAHPGKTVYLDKYEITAGRIRAFIARLASTSGGKPDVKGWIARHRPQIWDPAWDVFLPSDFEGGTITIGRRLLGDPRVEDGTGFPGPGVILPPATDEARHLGIHYQFGSEIYVDLHGNNCGTYPDSYGFPTYYYPPDILARDEQLPRADGVSFGGATIAANALLDVKSMNCITNAMLAAFCAWDEGQLATDEVLDFVTATPPSLGNVSGCGTQHDNHSELLLNKFDHTVQTGGRCAPVSLVNATFDAGDHLPVADSPLNTHNYDYPDMRDVTHDKAWQVSAPGRASLAADGIGQTDVVRVNPDDEPWVDLNGNLSEAALDMTGASFTGHFALKYRGIGYGSARSNLNTSPVKGEAVLRLQRPEAKAAFTGGRCMRFR